MGGGTEMWSGASLPEKTADCSSHHSKPEVQINCGQESPGSLNHHLLHTPHIQVPTTRYAQRPHTRYTQAPTHYTQPTPHPTQHHWDTCTIHGQAPKHYTAPSTHPTQKHVMLQISTQRSNLQSNRLKHAMANW